MVEKKSVMNKKKGAFSSVRTHLWDEKPLRGSPNTPASIARSQRKREAMPAQAKGHACASV